MQMSDPLAGSTSYILSYDPMFFATLVLGVLGLGFWLTREKGDE